MSRNPLVYMSQEKALMHLPGVFFLNFFKIPVLCIQMETETHHQKGTQVHSPQH